MVDETNSLAHETNYPVGEAAFLAHKKIAFTSEAIFQIFKSNLSRNYYQD